MMSESKVMEIITEPQQSTLKVSSQADDYDYSSVILSSSYYIYNMSGLKPPLSWTDVVLMSH